MTAWSEIAVDAKNLRKSKIEGGHGELLRSTFFTSSVFELFVVSVN